ncbi:MAG: GGDEF domain-containing protein [Clostridia bacterium]|nr:GGDEF domain-containing protein [Clostridia bacterium]
MNLTNYYTILIVLSWMTLGILCILVQENTWISKEDKRRFYMTYVIIALSAFGEWCGILLNGKEQYPSWILMIVKCIDYILTPFAGAALVSQMKLNNRLSKLLSIVLLFNTVFQLLGFFTHWAIVIDSHHYYSHGPLYSVYIAVYLLVILLTSAEFFQYGLSYQRQNQASLYAVLLLVITGISVQELLADRYRTAYIALTIGAALMFIHYSEFYQMSAEAHIQEQQTQLMKDALSGTFSRHAYMKALEEYRDVVPLPDDLTVFTFDINGLKAVNDSIGHEAGDELIIGAARCIENVIDTAGQCFRTGGDEFVVLAHMEKQQAEALLTRLEEESTHWVGKNIGSVSISGGFAHACDYQGFTIEKLIREADQAMYAAKAQYYKQHGNDRRAAR